MDVDICGPLHRDEEEPDWVVGCVRICLNKPGFIEYSASASVICKDSVYGVDLGCLGPVRC